MSMSQPVIALSALENALNYSRTITKTLSELRLPVIAINPDDTPTDLASMQANGVEVIIMTGVGHFLMLEEPDRFNQILLDAINKLVIHYTNFLPADK